MIPYGWLEQIGVIPGLIGLLFELVVVMPLRIPVDESPIFYFYKDWALGLVFLKIWTRLVSSSYPACSKIHSGHVDHTVMFCISKIRKHISSD